MSDAVLGAIVGALGAGVFSLLSSRFQASLQDRREDERRTRDELRAEAEAEGVERTITAGLEVALKKLAEGLPDDKAEAANWPSNPQQWSADWERHRDLMSRRWGRETFATAYSAYGRVLELERGMANKGGQPMEEQDRDFCERSRDEVTKALRTLRQTQDHADA